MQDNRNALAQAVSDLLSDYRDTLALAEDQHAPIPYGAFVGYRALERWERELSQEGRS